MTYCLPYGADDDDVEGEEAPPPPSPKTAAGNNMLPACITRLTLLRDLRLSGDWRRPKVTKY